MNLYLIRHGDAESITLAKSDHERELTHKGKESIKRAAEGWKKMLRPFDIIASSPLIRAVQTAEIIADVFSYNGKIITDKRIASGCKPDDLIDFVKSFQAENITIVGHEPDLSSNLSALVSVSGMYSEFKKGAIAKVEFEGRIRLSGGTLVFFIPANTFK